MTNFDEGKAGLVDVPAGEAPTGEGISLAALADYLGPRAAAALFDRIDGSLRHGDVIVGTNVRNARVGFSKAHMAGHAQVVVPGRSTARAKVSDGVVIIKMADLEAVVRAGQEPFDWGREFAPRDGLAAAAMSPELRRGSRGRRQFRV
jgi:hypothetical protein